MRILARVPGSVLLLQAASDTVERNLKAEARSRGLDEARLVFAPRVEFADYLSRLSVADLFLDTLPYNAGATASDALWAGLPVLTCRGETFAGRMGASLLTAIGMSELIAPDLEAYEDLAVLLATDRARLERIRSQLRAGRDEAALFDTTTFTRHLEAGFVAIYERAVQGLSPAHIAIDAANQVRVKN
jgi:predicted O-linked N-acetylglucosamine transferase (SPINDLY family)